MNKEESLKIAFEGFRVETRRLEKSYLSLRREFQSLQGQLRESLETLESIVAHIPEGLIYIDGEGIITIYNQAVSRLLEKTKDEVVFKPFVTVFSDNLFGFSVKEAIKGQTPPSLSLLTLQKGGEEFEVEVSLSKIPGEKGGLILLLRDLTEIRRLEQAVARGDRLKELGEMAAGLAHEIRNPLAGIEGFASLLETDLKERPDLAKKSRAIIEGTRSLNRLVTNVLQYSRPLKLHFVDADLTGLVKEVMGLLRAENQEYKKRLTLKCHHDPVICRIDPDLVKLALFNVILNGLQASPKTCVTVLIKRGGVIEIIDNGPGISPEHLETIFTPFFTTKTTGNGLGLSEVYKVIEAHGGTIEVDSKRGEGARFILTLNATIATES